MVTKQRDEEDGRGQMGSRAMRVVIRPWTAESHHEHRDSIIYQLSKDKVLKVIFVFGTGLSTVWLAKHFLDSSLGESTFQNIEVTFE